MFRPQQEEVHMHGGWRSYDRATQRDIERARLESPEAYEKALKEANHGYATFGGAQAGAIAGGVIGSVIPVIGTVLGAFIGAGIGAITGHNLTKD